MTPSPPHFSLKQSLRRPVRALATGYLRLRSRPLLLDAAPLLVVTPHQDDATLGCGGLLLKRRLAGHPVHVLYLTDGSASHPGHPVLTPAALARLRRDEARLAESRLGMDLACLHFLDLPDGRLDSLDPAERAAAVSMIASHLSRLGPATVLLPSRHDGSSEHEAGFRLVRDALARAGLRPRLLEYLVWAFWSPVLLLRAARLSHHVHHVDFPGHGPLKTHALDAYASQFRPVPPWPRPVMPEDFPRAFSRETEYFLESRT